MISQIYSAQISLSLCPNRSPSLSLSLSTSSLAPLTNFSPRAPPPPSPPPSSPPEPPSFLPLLGFTRPDPPELCVHPSLSLSLLSLSRSHRIQFQTLTQNQILGPGSAGTRLHVLWGPLVISFFSAHPSQQATSISLSLCSHTPRGEVAPLRRPISLEFKSHISPVHLHRFRVLQQVEASGMCAELMHAVSTEHS